MPTQIMSDTRDEDHVSEVEDAPFDRTSDGIIDETAMADDEQRQRQQQPESRALELDETSAESTDFLTMRPAVTQVHSSSESQSQLRENVLQGLQRRIRNLISSDDDEEEGAVTGGAAAAAVHSSGDETDVELSLATEIDRKKKKKMAPRRNTRAIIESDSSDTDIEPRQRSDGTLEGTRASTDVCSSDTDAERDVGDVTTTTTRTADVGVGTDEPSPAVRDADCLLDDSDVIPATQVADASRAETGGSAPVVPVPPKRTQDTNFEASLADSFQLVLTDSPPAGVHGGTEETNEAAAASTGAEEVPNFGGDGTSLESADAASEHAKSDEKSAQATLSVPPCSSSEIDRCVHVPTSTVDGIQTVVADGSQDTQLEVNFETDDPAVERGTTAAAATDRPALRQATAADESQELHTQLEVSFGSDGLTMGEAAAAAPDRPPNPLLNVFAGEFPAEQPSRSASSSPEADAVEKKLSTLFASPERVGGDDIFAEATQLHETAPSAFRGTPEKVGRSDVLFSEPERPRGSTKTAAVEVRGSGGGVVVVHDDAVFLQSTQLLQAENEADGGAIFLQPTQLLQAGKEADGDDAIFLQPTQLLQAGKEADGDDAIFLQPTQLLQADDGGAIFLQAGKEADGDDAIFLQPTQLLRAENEADGGAIFFQPTQLLRAENEADGGAIFLQAMKEADGDDAIFLQPTQLLQAEKEEDDDGPATSDRRGGSSKPNIVDSPFLRPTRILSACSRAVERDETKKKKDFDSYRKKMIASLLDVDDENANGASKKVRASDETERHRVPPPSERVVAVETNDDALFLQPTQLVNATEGRDGGEWTRSEVEESAVVESGGADDDDDDDALFLQPTQMIRGNETSEANEPKGGGSTRTEEERVRILKPNVDDDDDAAIYLRSAQILDADAAAPSPGGNEESRGGDDVAGSNSKRKIPVENDDGGDATTISPQPARISGAKIEKFDAQYVPDENTDVADIVAGTGRDGAASPYAGGAPKTRRRQVPVSAAAETAPSELAKPKLERGKVTTGDATVSGDDGGTPPALAARTSTKRSRTETPRGDSTKKRKLSTEATVERATADAGAGAGAAPPVNNGVPLRRSKRKLSAAEEPSASSPSTAGGGGKVDADSLHVIGEVSGSDGGGGRSPDANDPTKTSATRKTSKTGRKRRTVARRKTTATQTTTTRKLSKRIGTSSADEFEEKAESPPKRARREPRIVTRRKSTSSPTLSVATPKMEAAVGASMAPGRTEPTDAENANNNSVLLSSAERGDGGVAVAVVATPVRRGRRRAKRSPRQPAGAASDEDVPPPNSGGKRVRHTATSLTELQTSPERNQRKLKPRVVFTMLDNPELETIIRSLGGFVVDSVDASSVLLTASVKRSQKLLSAVGQAKPICSPNWLHECKKANAFLDPWDYILEDPEAESRWNFSLRESLRRSADRKLLENYTFQLMVSAAQDVLKGAIEACGGKCVSRAPNRAAATANFVIVSSPENKSKYARHLRQKTPPTIVAAEAIFDGVLRQELHLQDHLLS